MPLVQDFGKMSGQSFLFKELTWEIPNVLHLPKIDDYEVKSPEFLFANSVWEIYMYPYGQTKHGTESYVDFEIVRIMSRELEQNVIYKIFLVTCHGRQFEAFRTQHLFDNNYWSSVVTNYLARDMLIKKQKIVAPKGTLTVVCQMRTSVTGLAVVGASENHYADGTVETTKDTGVLETAPCQKSAETAQDKKLLGDLKKLLVSENCCDVTLLVGGQKFQAHRAILVARSPVFASMLNHDMKEKSTGQVDIKDCEAETFPAFLSFLYCGNKDVITSQNVCSLYRAADKYDVEDLKSECLEFMRENLALDNFCDTVALALQHGEADLIQQVIRFFAQNMKKIIVTVKWQTFLTENPIESNELLIKAVGA